MNAENKKRLAKYILDLYYDESLTRWDLSTKVAELENELDIVQAERDALLSDVPQMGGH